MNYSPPKAISWWIALVCFIIGLLFALKVPFLKAILPPILAPYLPWVAVAGLALLLLATVLPGL